MGFIEAGKVGVSLGNFKEKGRKVGEYYSLSLKSAKWAATCTQTTYDEHIQKIISSCDRFLFTVRERAKPYASDKLIGHCSNLHSSQIFSIMGIKQSYAYYLTLLEEVFQRTNRIGIIFTNYTTKYHIAAVLSSDFLEGHAHAVKLEGGADFVPHIQAIVKASIPVVAHIGLTPQSVNTFGGFKVQGKSLHRCNQAVYIGKTRLIDNIVVNR